MGLNIKNEEAHRLARRLADATGESLTEAVTEALRERLDRVQRQGMAERIMEISGRSAAHWREPFKSTDIDALLYDENGLPK